MEAVIRNRAEFLVDKVLNNDLILIDVISETAPQTLKARVVRVYSSHGGIPDIARGSEIEFVHAPASWGCVPLKTDDWALVFIADIAGKLYEDAWNGHLLVETVGDATCAIFPAKELWLDKTLPADIREAFFQDPKREYASAIRFEKIERYLLRVLSSPFQDFRLPAFLLPPQSSGGSDPGQGQPIVEPGA